MENFIFGYENPIGADCYVLGIVFSIAYYMVAEGTLCHILCELNHFFVHNNGAPLTLIEMIAAMHNRGHDVLYVYAVIVDAYLYHYSIGAPDCNICYPNLISSIRDGSLALTVVLDEVVNIYEAP